jgi:L-threonylcarbamoyladenylate synthase
VLRRRVRPEAPEPAAIREAVDVLERGGIVAYPTDTLYGLAVDPRSEEAVDRLFAVKGRDAQMAIPLIAGSIDQAEQFGVMTDRDRKLAAAFWPGPLTIVVAPRAGLSPKLFGGRHTIAIRVPAHQCARALATALGACVTSTSANRTGRPPAQTADEVAAAMGGSIDLLLDGGATIGGAPSTIVEIGADGPTLVRAGAIAWDRVLRSLG